MLLDNQPQDAYTVDRLTYKSAEMHARYKNKTKMVAALERLSRVEEKINFLKNHQYYDEAAEYLIKGGELVVEGTVSSITGDNEEPVCLNDLERCPSRSFSLC